MGSRWARVSRALLASSVAIFVAALFHVAGGGAAPALVPLALSLAFAVPAAIALTARRLSLWRLTLSVALSQFLFHLLFSVGAGRATFSTVDGTAGLAHVHAGSHLVMSEMATLGSAAHVDMGAFPATPAMWFGHASAVLVTVIAVRLGERAFWGLFATARMHAARFARRVATAVDPVSLAVTPTTVRAVTAEPSRLRDLGLPLGRLRHRGPPSVVFAF